MDEDWRQGSLLAQWLGLQTFTMAPVGLAHFFSWVASLNLRPDGARNANAPPPDGSFEHQYLMRHSDVTPSIHAHVSINR